MVRTGTSSGRWPRSGPVSYVSGPTRGHIGGFAPRSRRQPPWSSKRAANWRPEKSMPGLRNFSATRYSGRPSRTAEREARAGQMGRYNAYPAADIASLTDKRFDLPAIEAASSGGCRRPNERQTAWLHG
jgi:hypothetical protein